MTSQSVVNTRALEISTQALTRVKMHEKHFDNQFREITNGQKSIFNKLDQLQRNGFWMWLTVAGAVISVLLTIVAYLLTSKGVV